MARTARLILAACLALAASGAAAAGPPPGPIDVLHYEVSLRPDFEGRTISGRTEVRFRSQDATLGEISFSANALDVRSVTVDGREAKLERRDGAFVVVLPRALTRGRTSELVMSYDGRPARGLTFGPGYVYSNYFACDWMICSQDAPGDKATFTLTLDLPAAMTSHGPGQLRSRSRSAEGLERHVWREDRPYSAYLFGFAAGGLQRSTAKSGRTELVYLSPTADAARLAELFAPTPQMLAFFEEKAGGPIPHRRYVQLHVPGSAAQEAANFSVLGEGVLAPMLDTPQEDWAIAHELAHQWWGNAVTCKDWTHFWLNEGVTTFMVAAWKEHRWGRDTYDAELALLQRRVDEAARAGVAVPLTFAGPYATLAQRRAITYSKGALFMDQLRRSMGEAAFWRAMKAYTQANMGGVVDSRDFQRAFERSSGQDLSALFDAWVY